MKFFLCQVQTSTLKSSTICFNLSFYLLPDWRHLDSGSKESRDISTIQTRMKVSFITWVIKKISAWKKKVDLETKHGGYCENS